MGGGVQASSEHETHDTPQTVEQLDKRLPAGPSRGWLDGSVAHGPSRVSILCAISLQSYPKCGSSRLPHGVNPGVNVSSVTLTSDPWHRGMEPLVGAVEYAQADGERVETKHVLIENAHDQIVSGRDMETFTGAVDCSQADGKSVELAKRKHEVGHHSPSRARRCGFYGCILEDRHRGPHDVETQSTRTRAMNQHVVKTRRKIGLQSVPFCHIESETTMEVKLAELVSPEPIAHFVSYNASILASVYVSWA